MKYGVALLAVAALMLFGFAPKNTPQPKDCAGDCATNCSDECPNDSECYGKCLNKCLEGCNPPDVPEPPPPSPAPGDTSGKQSIAASWTSSPITLDGGDLCCYDGAGKLQGNCPSSLPWYKDTGLCYATERQCESDGAEGACYSCGTCK